MSLPSGRLIFFYSLDSNDYIVVKYAYDGLGRRISKNNINYTYDGSGNLIKSSNGFEFYYDSEGIAGFVYNVVKYVYQKDIQGNVIAILDSTGVVVGIVINGIFYTEINGKSIAGYIEDGIEGLLEWLF